MATLWLPTGADESGELGPATPAGARSSAIRFVVDSGWRPVVDATVDGVEVSMLIHANAGFLAMLTHGAMHRITGRRVEKERDFGLGHDLRPSSAGRGHADIDALTVAGRTLSGVRLDVFDLPTVNWDGMLGVDWLAETGAVVDFGHARLTVPETPGSRRSTSPSGSAAQGIRLDRDPDTGRYTCRLSPGRRTDITGRFVVSTVADTTLDLGFARTLGLDLGDPVDEEHGPTGAVVPVHRPAEPLTLVPLPQPNAVLSVRPSVYDIYAYAGDPRPTDVAAAVAGYVGADILLERGAVVDFGP